MSPSLRTVTALEDARRIAPRLDGYAAEYLSQFSDEPYPYGATERFLERSFGARETVLVVAEEPGRSEPVGVCLVGPLADPLLERKLPLILVLFVQPALRHRGLAKELVAEAQRRLAARGVGSLAGRVGHNDDALISMGERWGFTRVWELMLLE